MSNSHYFEGKRKIVDALATAAGISGTVKVYYSRRDVRSVDLPAIMVFSQPSTAEGVTVAGREAVMEYWVKCVARRAVAPGAAQTEAELAQLARDTDQDLEAIIDAVEAWIRSDPTLGQWFLHMEIIRMDPAESPGPSEFISVMDLLVRCTREF
ncbi:MAG: hypothetical protein ACYC9Q_14165 [Bacillota bacterium]